LIAKTEAELIQLKNRIESGKTRRVEIIDRRLRQLTEEADIPQR
jgi:hypothetical protein